MRLALLLLFACSCVPAPRDHYRVDVDPGFDSAHAAAILDALDAWSSRTPATFDVVMVAHTCGLDDTGTICISPATVRDVEAQCPGADHFGCSTRWTPTDSFRNEGDSAEVRLAVDELDAVDFAHAVRHELGHALALHHDGDADAVMFPRLAGGSPEVTRRDVEAYRAARGEAP